MERLLIPYPDIIVTVSESIADWYRHEYNLGNVLVIKNIPPRPVKAVCSRILRDHFQISDDDVLFIYQGALEEGRASELILECFREANQGRHIAFMGMGSLQEKIQRYAAKYSHIHFHNAVGPEEVIYYTASADVGIHLIENTCLNHYYCLPNKVFEYLFSGLPAIVSDFPEMSRIVKEEQCGWAIPVEKQALLRVVNNVSREEIAEKKKRAQGCSAKFGWQDEEKKLLEIYRRLLQLA
jgi:glycosyltransferase involved in cell wall biosynthesis